MTTQKKLFVENIQAAGKRVIVRVDFNVPLKDGKVESDKRLKESLPTIKYLKDKGAKVILMSHLGRPDGKRVPEMSLRPVADALSTLLGSPVAFADDCVGPAAEKAVAALKNGDVLLLENLRFHADEEENAPAFAKQLAALADVYVNDAFGTAHRAHASTEGITKFVSQAASGYLMKKELDYLGGALAEPKRPFVAIIGGSKVSGKIDVIKNLLPRVDKLLIGGGMTYTFLKAQGLEVGKSIVENDKLDLARSLLAEAGDKIVLGTDFVVTDKLDFKGRTVGAIKTVAKNAIPSDWEAVDAGPDTVAAFAKILLGAKTIIWNGPVGVFEIDATAKGTIAVAQALADATAAGATTIIGGGDSASAVKKAGVASKVSHVSTGGGASLEYLEGKVLPGVAALTNA
ncbi:MAG TPA: phosphoglycerate kinase [Polyangia bacterium]|jgi:phosphoglycerate kinase|nr:phosphoglycerate kinase [Polyangia bacterium]